ncbi:SGNH/GDSL hydrolase family protein [Flavihumibacter profundi]|uniref:SGNH/GDSL hydrolase family protein n=1 Tax=Flavihumibacter profundi TaxID=2716883 RepID=UPI001CC3A3A8|nr:SGNH/GDSL hydrolase family protein [Flavihumibacter profundi]MBZ5855602.1 SGNH/GDSL hydrolase family protein [Flavihumibacter profundi]
MVSYKLVIRFLSFVFFTLSSGIASSQKIYKNWNPAMDTAILLNGQAWPKEVKNYYDRLPARAASKVRKDVWDLSENSAGTFLRFRTDAKEILVKLKVTGSLQLPHMPATGVSGVDLYARNSDGQWLWCGGKFSFGDTITYQFNDLLAKDQYINDREYTLYLPLYNGVRWLEVSVPAESNFAVMPVSQEKPLVVYGTSIAQGACASRPGLAWTSILGRHLDQPVINLGFSGNGRLEKEVLDLVGEVDAKLYVLDCLPNLTSKEISPAALKNLIRSAILQLQSKRAGVPILLVEHDGFTGDAVDPNRQSAIENVNKAQKELYDSLLLKKVKDIYYLSKKEIDQDIESMVDGIHPNDLGMMKYALAYEKKIRLIFNEPAGTLTTTIPVTQHRDGAIYDWVKRHEEILARNKTQMPQTVLIGNSITHYWAGLPTAPIARGVNSWSKYFGLGESTNMGFGWDRIENVLWRVYHGELEGISPKNIVLMIGTNNIGYNSDREIAEGLKFLVNAIRVRQPKAKLLVMGILPRRESEKRVAGLNALIAKNFSSTPVKFADAGKLFIKKGGQIDESLFSDGLHPNEKGYEKLGAFIGAALH